MIHNGLTRVWLSGVVALLCIPVLPLRALGGENRAAADTSVALPAPYLLAGDDVISIGVVNFPNLAQTMITIPPDGKLSVPLLEPFSVLGKTTAEVAQVLVEKWRRYVINPSVSVSLVQKRKENVLVYGLVARPGTAEYRPPMRLLEAIGLVGGPLPTADLLHVTLTHKDGTRQTVDLTNLETRGGTEHDVPLAVGDVVYIPERHMQVSVVGEVQRPGSVDYKDDMTVEDAVVAAGGFRETTADLSGATLLHEGKETRLDLDALYRHGDASLNVKLAPGDRLLIPEMHNRTYVFGAVAQPGFYNFKPGDRILDALKATGGPTSEANLSKVNLIHIATDKKSATMTPINLQKFFQKGDMNYSKYNVALAPGDVVYVPDKKKTESTSNQLWGLLSGFNLVDGIGRWFTGKFGQ